mmetsp:Transcript_45/g.118  ORF Transcript_45/g.118 Transcript_45/m.118 type:complete len:261 (+) Transcript_45:100-882(+)
MQEEQGALPVNEVADKPTGDSGPEHQDRPGQGPPEEGGAAQQEHQEQTASALEQDDEALDQEAEELLAELARSQLEVKRMLGMQSAQAQQLGGLKEQLAAELHDLQDENWKLEVFGELEALKQQLSSLNGLEGRLDASEGILDATESRQGRLGPGETQGGEGEDAEADPDLKEDYNPEEIAELQAKLDADLADMFSQLQAVKSEASEVSTRKLQLERELQELLAQRVADADHQASDQDGKALSAAGSGRQVAATGEVGSH